VRERGRFDIRKRPGEKSGASIEGNRGFENRRGGKKLILHEVGDRGARKITRCSNRRRVIVGIEGAVKMLVRGIVTGLSTKTVEIAAPRMTLTRAFWMKIRGNWTLAAVIGEMGYEPDSDVGSGGSAEIGEAGAMPLLLADLHMPGMHRYEFLVGCCAAIRACTSL